MFSSQLFYGSGIVAVAFLSLLTSPVLAQVPPPSDPPSSAAGIARATSRIGYWQNLGSLTGVTGTGSYNYDTDVITQDATSKGTVEQDTNSLAFTAKAESNQDSEFTTSVYCRLTNPTPTLKATNNVYLGVYAFGDASRTNPSGQGTFTSASSEAAMGYANTTGVAEGSLSDSAFYLTDDAFYPSVDEPYEIVALEPNQYKTWTGSIHGRAIVIGD